MFILLVGFAYLAVSQPYLIAHEKLHAVALERLGYNSEVRFERMSIAGVQLPILGRGACRPRPYTRWLELSPGEIVVITMAPLLIPFITLPIPIALSTWAASMFGGSVLTGAVWAVGIWTLVWGPSGKDWWMTYEAIFNSKDGRVVRLQPEWPAISADDPHRIAEGILP